MCIHMQVQKSLHSTYFNICDCDCVSIEDTYDRCSVLFRFQFPGSVSKVVNKITKICFRNDTDRKIYTQFASSYGSILHYRPLILIILQVKLPTFPWMASLLLLTSHSTLLKPYLFTAHWLFPLLSETTQPNDANTLPKVRRMFV